MALVKCKACGAAMSAKAVACPTCGHPNPTASYLPGWQVAAALALVGIAIWWFANGGLEQPAVRQAINVEDRVAADSVKQYEIAKRQGDRVQICVQAGFVAAAYLQAKDEPNYQQWKATEASECKRADISQ